MPSDAFEHDRKVAYRRWEDKLCVCGSGSIGPTIMQAGWPFHGGGVCIWTQTLLPLSPTGCQITTLITIST